MTISPPSLRDPLHDTRVEEAVRAQSGALPPAPARALWRRHLPHVVALVAVLAVALGVVVVSSPEEGPAETSTGGAVSTSAGNDRAYDEAYGTFEELATTGTGSGSIPLPQGARSGLVTVRHDGPGYLDIGYLERATAWSLISWTGARTPYRGTIAFGLDRPVPARSLEVWTDGPWGITISPVSSADVLTDGATGTRDAVLRYDGDAAEWSVEHEGRGYFAIQQWPVDGVTPHFVASGVGSYEGIGRARAGPSVVTIYSDGSWRITVE